MNDPAFTGIENAIASRTPSPEIDRKFWADVARMWPRNWWSPVAQWRDFWLRHYARTKLYQLQKRASVRRQVIP